MKVGQNPTIVEARAGLWDTMMALMGRNVIRLSEPWLSFSIGNHCHGSYNILSPDFGGWDQWVTHVSLLSLNWMQCNLTETKNYLQQRSLFGKYQVSKLWSLIWNQFFSICKEAWRINRLKLFRVLTVFIRAIYTVFSQVKETRIWELRVQEDCVEKNRHSEPVHSVRKAGKERYMSKRYTLRRRVWSKIVMCPIDRLPTPFSWLESQTHL